MSVQKYLVVWDYGVGGIWRAVYAESAAAITDLYPELDVVDENALPNWMTHAQYIEWRDRRPDLAESLDEDPRHLLALILEQRHVDSARVGQIRPVFTVGYDDDTSSRWTWLRANTEVQIRTLFPELKIRHGRDDEWFSEHKALGLFDAELHDIDDPDDQFLDGVRRVPALANQAPLRPVTATPRSGVSSR
ncbi:hypothetical protein [Subtercola frigoramans]|uniref:Uncharacterized protein n=1 Tax=Subtercola frigoramans TaxID=120298 RepID=A0ABS2L491_9MICO|nr:hypothetical protein [Subtercola frigoramans]MBM7471912.1 hypothetical protein [Subtercola frigoramans]